MFCLSKVAAQRVFLGKSKMFQLLSSNYSQLVNKNVFWFASKTINLPFLADSINEGTITEFVKKEGDWVEQDQTVANVQTDKVTVEIKSPHAGKLLKFHVGAGDSLDVGKPLFDIDPESAKPAGQAKKQQPKKQVKKEQTKKQEPKPQKKQQTKSKPAETKPAKQAPKPAQSSSVNTPFERKEVREPMSRLRQRVAQRLKQSQNNYALLTTFQQVDMQAASDVRKELGEDFFKKYGVKLGFMSFFVRAAAMALQEFPVVNSVIDGNEIVRRNYVDISVAVATPTGLLVPVLRNVQNMKFHDIENGIAELAKKGKQGKITLEDMQGGTFTISNGGTFGSLMGTPIINPPQSAILGMHAIVNRPVVRGTEIVSRPMMYLALTYDHRLLDGKDAVLFLKKIQTHIQDPRRMLLDI